VYVLGPILEKEFKLSLHFNIDQYFDRFFSHSFHLHSNLERTNQDLTEIKGLIM
jgi:hypothetical protein